MNNRDKKELSINKLKDLLTKVENDTLVMNMESVEAHYSGNISDEMNRIIVVPKLAGLTYTMNFDVLTPAPLQPEKKQTDDWKELILGKIPDINNFLADKYEIHEGDPDINTFPELCNDNILDILKWIKNRSLLNPVHKFYYRLKPEPPQPTIIKSGDTWVAEYEGVDYLCTDSKRSGFLEEDFTPEKICEWWKPISEIDITDEIAKLRPMVINASLKRPLILYAVNRVGMFICEKGVEKHLLNLATVKDLQE